MERIEERPVGAVPGVFHGAVGRSTEPRPGWWLVAGGAAVALIVGLVVGRATADTSSSGDDDVVEDVGPRVAEEVLAPGSPLGSIEGTTAYRASDDDDVERYRYAWPGQILTAPEPATGDAVAWQWETCEVPPAPDEDEEERPEPRPLECRAVETATDDTWESPPTNQIRLVRVLVTVDLGDDVQVQAASIPVAAMPWPEDITPGDPPPEATPTEPPPASE